MSELAFIIEDDDDLSVIFAEALQKAGFELEILRDGEKASKRLDETVPYVILLDMHLPYISGAELLTKIKADDRFEKTIIIITTADALMGDAYRDQVDFVLLKPISFVQLRDLMARLKPKT